MKRFKYFFPTVAVIVFLGCGSSHARIKELPVMRQPIEIMKGGEMWEKWSFSFITDGPYIYALTGGDKGISLTSLRQDGAELESRLLIPKDESWWDFSDERLEKICGDEEVFEEKARIVLSKKGIVMGKDSILVAFGTESELSCKSSREEPFEMANYFLALFDSKWELKAGPWMGKSEEKVLVFIPVLWQGRAALEWLTEKAVGFNFAPENFEGGGEPFSRSIDMKLAPEWGRCAVLETMELEGDLMFAAAYAEEESYEPRRNRVTLVSTLHSNPDDVTITRLRTRLTPTAIDLRSTGKSIILLWAVTGPAPPAGTITSILKTDVKVDGTVNQPETVFEKKDMAGASFLIKKLAFSCDKKKIAVGWVYDIHTMDGMEERIGLFTSRLDDLDGGRVYSYPLKSGQRGVKNICITCSNKQYIILWEHKGLHQVRTAISSI